MEWAASKLPSWDMVELDQDTDTSSMVSFAGSSSGRQLQDCSVDLKLGGLGDLSGQWNGLTRVVQPAPVPAPAKRARAPGGPGQAVATCLVDGCKSDLSHCREYHRRHKVCEVHSKTPVVMVGSQEQRFCQQCSRFHMLSEFDEVKRSCRKRLDGHNRRRRKPQHDAMNPRSFFPNHQVNQFSLYPPIFPTTAAEPNWGRISMHHSPLHLLDRQPPFSISFSGTFRASKRFPFLKDGNSILGMARPALLRSLSSAESTSSSTSEGLTRAPDPECALSLLSSWPHPAAADIANVGPLHDTFSPHSTVSQGATAAVFAADGAVGDHVLVSDVMFEEPSQALPFSWEE